MTGVEGPNEEELLLVIGRVERGSIGWEMDRNLGEAELELFWECIVASWFQEVYAARFQMYGRMISYFRVRS